MLTTAGCVENAHAQSSHQRTDGDPQPPHISGNTKSSMHSLCAWGPTLPVTAPS
ncbi:hypothetical protein I542_2404 [Mycobacteroides abscessus 1948]|uniref:Uncharacterized protein n=1 Tax=Mycobacteroides abscessus 1948 TaxID=1299323 RepID=A0A829QHH3_9MYCO|nr:hypothetical protein I542_2404 [Mycobacteroides abscessus 1948]